MKPTGRSKSFHDPSVSDRVAGVVLVTRGFAALRLRPGDIARYLWAFSRMKVMHQILDEARGREFSWIFRQDWWHDAILRVQDGRYYQQLLVLGAMDHLFWKVL